MARDLRFLEFWINLKSFDDLEKKVVNMKIKEVVNFFSGYIETTQYLRRGIPIMLSVVRARTLARTIATHDKHNVLFFLPEKGPQGDELKELDALSEKVFAEIIENEMAHPDENHSPEGKGIHLSHELFKKHKNSKSLHGAFEGILIFFLLHSWSAVESCLEKLFRVIVDESTVARGLLGDEKRIVAMNFQRRGVTPPAKNLKSRFGIGDERFRTLRDIRFAYSRAFSSDYDKIDEALSSPYLDCLAQLRNVYVHGIGIPDPGFFLETEGLSKLAKFRNAPKKRILLTGRMLSSFVEGALHQMKLLIQSSDKWLQKHS